jgi:chromosomal replication initiator protein
MIALIQDAQLPRTVQALAARELGVGQEEQPDNAHLIVIEDVQRLHARAREPLARLIDACQARRRQLVLTATSGPAQLDQPGRLRSRLAGGLVVGLHLLSPESRRTFLKAVAERGGVKLKDDVLAWLSRRLEGSARRLEGAIARLEALSRTPGPLDLRHVREAFAGEEEGGPPALERIVQCVARRFGVTPAKLRSKNRLRKVLLARQTAMYLARRHAGLSFQAIGKELGKRDHTTVMHACRKLEQAITTDLELQSAVCQLEAELEGVLRKSA